jgi:hypothetical protein
MKNDSIFWLVTGVAIGVLTVISLYGMFALVLPERVFSWQGAFVVVVFYTAVEMSVGSIYRWFLRRKQ